MPGPGEEPPLLVSPAGGAAPLPGRLLRNGWFRIERTLLEGGNGLYRVRMAGPGALEYDLRLRAPRRVRMAASDG